MCFFAPMTAAKMSEDAKVPLRSITNRAGKRSSEPLKSLILTEAANGNGTATLSRKSVVLQPCDNCLGQDEYIKSLQSALREVSEENEVLRERVVELEALLSQLEEDIQDKDAQLVGLEGKAKRKSKPVV